MVHDEIALRMIEALQGASSLQLSQMQALIEGMLADTKRMTAARAALHLGQAVHFIDHRTGQVRRGKLIAQHDMQATVLEAGVSRTWKIPYVAIEAAPKALLEEPVVYDPPPEPAARAGRDEFRVGDRVTFGDGKGHALVGLILRINRRTATLQTMDAKTWRVDFQLLRHVVEV